MQNVNIQYFVVFFGEKLTEQLGALRNSETLPKNGYYRGTRYSRPLCVLLRNLQRTRKPLAALPQLPRVAYSK